jgi:hypothetical protein
MLDIKSIIQFETKTSFGNNKRLDAIDARAALDKRWSEVKWPVPRILPDFRLENGSKKKSCSNFL